MPAPAAPRPQPEDSMEEAPVAQRGRSSDPRLSLLDGPLPLVLDALVDGDPLGLRARVSAELLRRTLWLDPDRVHLRSLARVARHGRRGSRAAPDRTDHAAFEAWLDAQVRQAVDDVRAEEAHLAWADDRLQSAPQNADQDAQLDGIPAHLAAPLELQPRHARWICAALNALTVQERQALRDLVVSGEEPDVVARRQATDLTNLARRARRALLVATRTVLGEGRDRSQLPEESDSTHARRAR